MFRPDQSHPLKGVRQVNRLFVAVGGTLRDQRGSEVHESSVFRFCSNSHTSDNLMSQRTTEVHFYPFAGLVDNHNVIYHPHRMHGLPGYYPLWQVRHTMWCVPFSRRRTHHDKSFFKDKSWLGAVAAPRARASCARFPLSDLPGAPPQGATNAASCDVGV